MKKTAFIMMIIAMMLTVAACSGGNNGNNGNNGNGSAGTNSANGTGDPGATSATDGGSDNALTGDKPELRQLLPYNRIDPNSDYIANFLEEKTGYKVKYEMLPEEMPDEKLNLLMANKEPYDFMTLTKSQFFNLAEAGALEPLDDLLDQYGPNMKAGIMDETWKAATLDDKIYAIPQAGTGTAASMNLVMRKDWLDELGLAVPTTRDELYNVLKTIKEKKKVIPLVGYESIEPNIARTFGIANPWEEVDGKLIHQAENPRMSEYLAFMNKLYKEGLIDSEWPINTGSKVIEKFSSGQAAMMSLAWWSAPSMVGALKKNFPDAELVTLPYLPQDNGKAVIGVNTGITYFIAIPKWSKNKEHAVNLMNEKLEPALFKELVIGEEGVHHKFEDGKYFPILPKFNDDLNNGSYFLTGVDERTYADYWQARVRKDPVLQGYYDQFQEQAKGLFIIDPMSNAEPIPSIAEHTQKLAKFTEDTFLTYIAGSASLDTFESYLAQWKADGGEEMVNDANAWYAAHK
ncbi:extracellular solute-binding protein [Paenibacillus sp. HB172176]|uniref:extracellular solute-binding protein n=1 Tax=Paenibacillus sp. HB172176 TaxID=2493690 RepID=UPI001F0D8949|nr:extracellular solute-binding protein [Paenibacillus sp. HB172176]